MPTASPGYLLLVDHSLQYVVSQTKSIANPLQAIELKLLIQTRLQDLAKLKELTLSEHVSTDTLEEILHLEQGLLESLARCEIFFEDRQLYSAYVVHKKMIRVNESMVERWSRRATRLGYLAMFGLLGFAIFRALQMVRPHIKHLDL